METIGPRRILRGRMVWIRIYFIFKKYIYIFYIISCHHHHIVVLSVHHHIISKHFISYHIILYHILKRYYIISFLIISQSWAHLFIMIRDSWGRYWVLTAEFRVSHIAFRHACLAGNAVWPWLHLEWWARACSFWAIMYLLIYSGLLRSTQVYPGLPRNVLYQFW